MRTLPFAAAALSALVLTACSEVRGDDRAFGERVRAYLLEHPEVLEEAISKLEQKRADETASNQVKALAANRRALERDPRDFVANPNGKVTVVEFFDYRCGYCKSVAPEVIKLVRENPDVRFVFKEWPIFGEISDHAARVQIANADRPEYLQVHQRLMAEKALDEAALERVLRESGVDPAAARKEAAAKEAAAHLQNNQKLARALGIEGTPAFIVGDTLIPGADIQALKQAISEARGGKGPTRARSADAPVEAAAAG